MICPQCRGIDRLFNERVARRDLARYRRRGPRPATRLLLEAIVSEGVQDATLLDVGGGVGTIQHELLAAGASRATAVEGSAAYAEAAIRESRRRGHGDRVQQLTGDFVEVAERVEPADVVTLDRVICCYPDMPALVQRSAARARRLYGLVYPREVWLVRLALPLVNLIARLRRCPMRVYLHPPAAVARVATEAGLSLHTRRRTMLWEVALYGRSPAKAS